MTGVTFEWDSRDLAVWRGGKVEFALARALRMAGNKAARTMQDLSVEHVQSRKWLREEFIRKGMPLSRPKTKTALEDMEWTERVSGERIELSRFPHIQTASGVSVRINRGLGTSRIRSAFVATNTRGHVGVFMRRGKKRLPVDELASSRLVDVMQDPGVIDAIQGKALTVMETAFSRGLERELQKLKVKGDA